MNIIARDALNLSALRPSAIAAYLRGAGWRFSEQIENKAVVWTRAGADEEAYEVVLPMRSEVRDYMVRIAEVVQTLEAVEERPKREIYADMVETTSDTVRLHLHSERYEDGSMPLDQGVRVMEQARELLLAAACAAVQPRALYPARKPSQAMEYLSRLRLGQTERGSYVVAIRAAIPPRLYGVGEDQNITGRQQQTLFPELTDEREEPFARRVTLMLARALVSAQQAAASASQTGEWKPFQDAVALGVSANLCDALAGLRLDDTLQDVHIGLSWSPARPVSERLPRRIAFTSDIFPVLSEAARQFRESAPMEDFELLGPVVKLEHMGDSGGSATILGLVEGKVRHVHVFLEPQMHQQAIAAYQQEHLIQCEGELVKQGRTYTLRTARNFTVIS